MKKILLASVAALGLAGTASAAELDVRAPAALPLPIFTWTGCYLGINGGWIGDTSDITTSRGINPGFADPGRAPTTAVNLVTHSYKDNDSNGTFGGQFGCQYQWGWFVLGGEWDANWSGEKKDNYFAYPRVTDPATGFFWAPRTELTHTQLDWFSTARVRIGAAWWDRLLLYATGGLAFGAVDAYTQVATNEGGTNPFFSPSYFGAFRQDRIGWTAGGGFEWAFAQNWTAKAEFLYVDLGTDSYVSPRTTFGTLQNGVLDGRTWNTDFHEKAYIARVGINYLFHLGPAVAPVVARY